MNSLGDMSVGEAWHESRGLADDVELDRSRCEVILEST